MKKTGLTNQQVIDRFVNREGEGKSSDGHLYIRDTRLINYWTTIAEWINDGLFIVSNKYSQTTSKIQNKLRDTALNFTPCTHELLNGKQNNGWY
jgi:hypothetical protein